MKLEVPLSKVWIALPLFASLALAFIQRVRPHDYWWHLAMGRRVSTGVLPTTNAFLYTRPVDEAFFNQPWLGQWLMFQMHKVTEGPLLGVIFLSLSCLIFSIVIMRAFSRASLSPQLYGILTILALASSKPIFSVRTRMFAIVPLVLVTTFLFRYREKGNTKFLLGIPFIVVFWANTHGSFIVGVLLVWLLFFDGVWVHFLRKFRKEEHINSIFAELKPVLIVGATAIMTTIAGTCHPFGVRVYQYVFHLALGSTVASTVTEWQALSIQKPIGVFVFLLTLPTLWFLFKGRKNHTLFPFLVAALGIYLGFSSERSLLFFGGLIPFSIASFLPKSIEAEERPSSKESILNTFIIGMLFIGVIFSFPLTRPMAITASLDPTRTSPPGVGILSQESISPELVKGAKRIFHEQAIGGQLEYIFDGPVAFVDQRMEYIPEYIWNEYGQLSSAVGNWRRIIEKYNIDRFVLHTEKQKGLIEALSKTEGFKEISGEGFYRVFVSLDGFKDPLKKHTRDNEKNDVGGKENPEISPHRKIGTF